MTVNTVIYSQYIVKNVKSVCTYRKNIKHSNSTHNLIKLRTKLLFRTLHYYFRYSINDLFKYEEESTISCKKYENIRNLSLKVLISITQRFSFISLKILWNQTYNNVYYLINAINIKYVFYVTLWLEIGFKLSTTSLLVSWNVVLMTSLTFSISVSISSKVMPLVSICGKAVIRTLPTNIGLFKIPRMNSITTLWEIALTVVKSFNTFV